MTVSTFRSTARGWVEVDLASLVANARTVQAAAPGAALLPMVKADAYGLGAVAVARALDELDPFGFGVATVEEGAHLRAAGVRRPIIVFTPARSELQDAYRAHHLTAVVEDPDVAAAWDGPFHVEIDTGMGRCGVRWDATGALERLGHAAPQGAFTHFAAADRDAGTVERQWSRFQDALGALGRRPPLIHAANSAAAFRLRQPADLVRPGIFLYGGRPGPDLPSPRPVVSLRAPVVSLRRLSPGEPVSYGGDWTAPRATTVATLAVGYADGIPRAVQGRAAALLGGRSYPVVGRITMDFVMVDLGPDGGPGIAVGDRATLIGRDGDEEITVDTFAAWGGTVSYEVIIRLGPRLPREYRPA